jgi:hypothetical protein
MSAVRARIRRLEREQLPVQIVVAWLEGVHAWQSAADYARSELLAPESERELMRLWRHLERTSPRHDPGVSSGARQRIQFGTWTDVLFLRALAIELEGATAEAAEDLGLRLSILLLGEGSFREHPMPRGFVFGRPDSLSESPLSARRYEDLVDLTLLRVDAEQEARSAIETRYFAGRSIVSDESAAELARLRWQADELTERCPPLLSRRRRRRIRALARARAADLVDTARIATLRHLHQDQLADRIVARRLLGDGALAR